MDMYDVCLAEMGNNHLFLNSIFIIESIVELHVIYEFLKKGYSIKNVYDCFWMKSSQINEQEAKKTIEKITIQTLKEIKENILMSD